MKKWLAQKTTQGGACMQACSFTGHRKIEEKHIGKIDELLLRAIAYAYGEGCRKFYVGGALGFDTIAAKQVIFFRMSHPDAELHVIVPCKNQCEGWSPSQISMYEYTLSSADHVEYLFENYRDGCMRARNQRLVDLSDIIIAYVARDHSGAAQTVRMAKRSGKTVYNLYPTLDS